MLAPPKRKLTLVCLFVVSAVLSAQTAQAYTLVDWMRMWPNNSRAPAAPVYPATPYWAPPAALPGTPGSAVPGCGTPVPSCGTPMTSGCGTPLPAGCGTSMPTASAAPAGPLASLFAQTAPQQVVVSYLPDVSYRTSFVRVPTTNYRPINTVDPVTGYTATAMLPCTTYSWQLQRVPYTTYRPVYGAAMPTSAAYGGCAVVGYNAAPVLGGVPNGCATCAPATVAPAAPYYTPGPAMAPAMPTGPAIPTYPSLSQPPGYQPILANPAAPRSPTPADLQPSLSPGNSQYMPRTQTPGPTVNYPPSSPSMVPVPSSTVPVPSFTLPLPPPPTGASTKLAPTPRTNTSVVPVPDPEAGQNRQPTPAAPTVFDPHDRTAQRLFRSAGDIAPIVWPEGARNSDERLATLDQPVTTRAATAADSRGWRAVNP